MKIDIIIPAYNAKKTIIRTLFSISVQKNITDIHVYIVNDASEYDYKEEINFFKDYLDIKELTLKNNSGPGVARQYGIDNSKSKYIMFIDSDDYLYDPYSIHEIYENAEKNNADYLVSNFIYERDNKVEIKKKNLIWLHGKLFKRDFLEKNDIKFNDTRANEDNGFNRLILFHNPKIIYLNKITYVYSENGESITRKDNRLYKFTGLKWFTYNINWAMNIALNKNLNKIQVFNTSLSVLVAMYYYYLELYNDFDVGKIFSWCKDIKKIFDKYKELYLYDEMIDNYLNVKNEEYKGIEIKKYITFEEFLNKI